LSQTWRPLTVTAANEVSTDNTDVIEFISRTSDSFNADGLEVIRTDLHGQAKVP